ncbi:MAG TPA: hypothetical protein QF468_05390 [Nitrospinota bacterium]|nr:hypothetical protein [Nitrospinota bacterium]|tara:strand:- start:1527 stop:2417 length:891 start_codon:yes stop_codon:yes gene_type:complete
MNPLIKDIQSQKQSLDEFIDVTKRVLIYLPSIISGRKETRGYTLLSSEAAGTKKFVRPICNNLFIFNPDKFQTQTKKYLSILDKLQGRKKTFSTKEFYIVDSVTYTIQQSVGVALDLLSNPNSARKHVGNRFEELIRLVISKAGISNKKVVFKIPYPTEEGEKMYSCETDMIISPFKTVKSNVKNIDKREIVLSLKNSSKDRMGKIFLDKLLMERFAGHPVKVVGIFLNDVQRKEEEGISYTFVSGLFMVYTKFLCVLEGVYFLDPPPKTKEAPYNKHVLPFSKFLLEYLPEFSAP